LLIFQELEKGTKQVTHSVIRKSGRCHYIIYRIDHITLLIVMAT